MNFFIRKLKIIPKYNLLVLFLNLFFIVVSFFIFNITVRDYQNLSLFKGYFESEIDLLIPSPSIVQVEQIEKRDEINFIEPYIYTNVDITNKSKIIIAEILIFNNNFTERKFYSSNQVIKASKSNFELGVDDNFLNKHGLKIGDKLSFYIKESAFELEISHLFYNNPFYPNGAVIMDLTEEIKNAIYPQNSTIYFSSAFVSSSNLPISRKYFFNDYKPLGRLGSNYSNEQYEVFIKQDFSKEITDLFDEKTVLNNRLNNTFVDLIQRSWIYVATFFLFNILSIFISKSIKENKKIIQLINKTKLDYTNKFNNAIELNTFSKLTNRLFFFILYIAFMIFYFIEINKYSFNSDIRFYLPFLTILVLNLAILIFFRKPEDSFLW